MEPPPKTPIILNNRGQISPAWELYFERISANVDTAPGAVTSVFGRSGAVLAVAGDYDHSELGSIGTDDHHNEAHTVASHSDTSATGTELNTLTDDSDADSLHRHAIADAHIADSTLHFTEASINHGAIKNSGSNTHAMIDAHIAIVSAMSNGSIPFISSGILTENNADFSWDNTNKRLEIGGFVGVADGALVARMATSLGSTLGDSQVISQLVGTAGGNQIYRVNTLYRDSAGSSWTTARWHDHLAVDASFHTPQTDTKVWWERDPNNNIQSWGNGANTYLTIKAGNVGIGTTVPEFPVHVALDSGALPTTIPGTGLVVNNNSNTADNAGIGIVSGLTGYSMLLFGDSADINAGQIIYYNSSNAMTFRTTGAGEDLRIDTSGNIGIGVTSFGASSQKVLAFKNGTAPTSNPADTCHMHARDVSSSSELFVEDEAANETQLTAHPGDYLNSLPVDVDHEFPWVHRTSNKFLGKRITVDMEGVVRELERLSGKTFITMENIPAHDWDTNQENIRIGRETERAFLQSEIDRLNIAIAVEQDVKKKAGLLQARSEITIPASYTKKPPPSWMKARGVITVLE